MITPISRLFVTSLLFVMSSLSVAAPQTLQTDKLIPRAMLFSDPQFTQVRISPNGKHLSYLAPHQGVLNVWVGDPKIPNSMHPISDNQKRGVASYFWAYNNRDILFIDDNEGNENWRIYKIDVHTRKKTVLASLDNVQTRIVATSRHLPNEILIGLNQRRPDFHDVYRLNIRTGKLTSLYQNNSFSSFICDENLNIRFGVESTPEGGAIVYALAKDFSKTEFLKIGPDDILTTEILGLNKNNDAIYLLDSRDRNTAALTMLDIKTQKSTIIGENDKADISNVMIHPVQLTIEAYASTYEKTKWTVVDKSIAKDWDYLNQFAEGECKVIDRTLNDKTWLVVYFKDDRSPQYYYYDRSTQKAHFLFSAKPDLDKETLTHMHPIVIPARDGLSLVSYLSLPKAVQQKDGLASAPVPLVLFVHGGPHARDAWGCDPEHQWLTNRGYAVLSVNYRGSSGLGKKFANAGNAEWAGKMHDDLLDAVEWAIQHKITQRDTVAIMGGSYGGYATLVGLTFSPTVFACGIDIVGPSNLTTLLASIPPYWKSFYATLKNMVGGDPETESGRAFLASRSPINFIQNITKPLLIAQGANDPRVKEAESQQIVDMMHSKQIPVTYALYPDEGHGFRRPENRLSFYAIAEAFLAQHLKGKFEPIHNDFKNASVQFKVGKEFITDLPMPSS